MTFAIPLLFCVLAWYLGGLPWIIVGFFTLAILNLGGARVKEISMVCALALIWLLAFKLTGDRRLHEYFLGMVREATGAIGKQSTPA